MNGLQTQVKVVAWLHIFLGALSLMGGLFIALIFGALGGFLGGAATGHALPGVLAGFGVGTIVFILVGVFSLPNLLVGYGLLHGAEWARVVGIIVSILSLVHPVIGLGTAIAIYSLVVLFTVDHVEMPRPSP